MIIKNLRASDEYKTDEITDRIYFLMLVQSKEDRLKAALSCSDTEGKPV